MCRSAIETASDDDASGLFAAKLSDGPDAGEATRSKR